MKRMNSVKFLVSCLTLVIVTMAKESEINHSVETSDGTKGDKNDCHLHTVEERVILNCSGVHIHETMFKTYDKKVHVLDITNCRLTNFSIIRGFADSVYNSLLVLNASQNRIKDLECDSFKMFKNLEKLDLSYNIIETLPADVFMSLPDLRFLDLSNNKLTSLPNKLPMTEWFDISSNKITSLSETFSSVLYPQTVFLLGKNPFKCTCDLLWLKDLLGTRQYLLNFVDRLDPQKFMPVCSSPENLFGKSWNSLEDHEFKCIGLDEKSSPPANEKSSIIKQEEIKVTVSEIGPNWVMLKWNGNVDISENVIEINYHEFGKTSDKKQVILPVSATGYRIRNLDINTPYIICFSITVGTDSYFLGCEEIITAKILDSWSFWYIYRCIMKTIGDYSNYLIISIILLLSTLYFFQRMEMNKEDNT